MNSYKRIIIIKVVFYKIEGILIVEVFKLLALEKYPIWKVLTHNCNKLLKE